MKPLVIKIGGSLAESGRLAAALEIVARARRPIMVVPGGPFADAVRAAQNEIGFSDSAAHDMALLAMHQMAQIIVALEPSLVAAETMVAMRRTWRARRIPVWLPARLARGDRRIPRDWSITSDGLAARLAERLGKAPLVLVKSCRVAAGASAAELSRRGVVDPIFAEIVTRAGLEWRVIGPGEEGALRELVAAREPRSPGTKARAERSTARR